MGKYEVLGVLTILRDSGDERFLRYHEVHRLLLDNGLSISYTSVWRSVNGLFSDGFLEVRKDGSLLSRTLSFRLKKSPVSQVSGLRRVYNTYREGEDKLVGGEDL